MDDTKAYTFREKLVICFYELLGTMMLVLGYNFTSAGLAVGFNLFVGIIMSAKVSGGMFNPAVTIGVYTADKSFVTNIVLVLMIIVSQVIGAYLGILYAHLCLGQPAFLCPYDQMTGCLSYDSFGKVFLLEFWCTFFFVMVILCCIHTQTQESKDGILHAASIAFTLLAMINTAGAISGGCFNPAFGFAQTTYQVAYASSQGIENASAYARYLWVYILAPTLGGLASSLFMRFVHIPNLHK